jgi:hypothetical protein
LSGLRADDRPADELRRALREQFLNLCVSRLDLLFVHQLGDQRHRITRENRRGESESDDGGNDSTEDDPRDAIKAV